MNIFRPLLIWCIAVAVFVGGMGSASAHGGFENRTDVRIYQDRIDIFIRTSYGLAWKILGDRAPATADEANKEIAKPLLAEAATHLFDLTADGKTMPPKSSACFFELNQDVAFKLTYARPAQWPLVLHARFFNLLGPLDSGTVSVFDQTDHPYQLDIEPIAGKVISARNPTMSVSIEPAPVAAPAATIPTPPPSPAKEYPSFGQFVVLGIRHILTGYDHLLFLFALLLGCRSLRPMLVIVTAFTLAHSLTLALATFQFVNLPSRWVESFIALSIVYVGVENLIYKGAAKRREWLTFAFGLVHGLGFAGVLKDIGLGAGGKSILPPLLAFNLGVETGQLALVLLALPLLIQLRKSATFARLGTPALSAVVVLLGSVWLIQRAILNS